MKPTNWLIFIVLLAITIPMRTFADQPRKVNGLVLSVDAPHQKLIMSCQEIPGVMDAKVMAVAVPDAKLLNGIGRGSLVEFTLRANGQSAYADDIRVSTYDSAEREPANARRLATLDKALSGLEKNMLLPGQAVPDFTLVDQDNRSVRLRQFKGKVILVNFVYTRCTLPNYCFRMTNHFGIVQKREKEYLGRDLILLTVTFDPVHDRPDDLRSYAKTWNADPENWRFLTGAEAEVQRVCSMFGVNAFADEGLFVHSLHTVLIDRDGKLIANLEGNQFTAQQLSDLAHAAMNPQS